VLLPPAAAANSCAKWALRSSSASCWGGRPLDVDTDADADADTEADAESDGNGDGDGDGDGAWAGAGAEVDGAGVTWLNGSWRCVTGLRLSSPLGFTKPRLMRDFGWLWRDRVRLRQTDQGANSAARMASTRLRLAKKSRWPKRDAERTWITFALRSNQNSVSSVYFISGVVNCAYR
jgi:hypothetical protein